MSLKSLVSTLIISGIVLTTGIAFAASKNVQIPTSFVYQAISKYKNKNYTGCIQDMDYIIQKGRPSDIVYYYRAISYSQLGMPDKARESYDAARNMSRNRVLIDYATQAINCIDDATLCDANLDDSDITKFIKSNEFMHNDVKTTLENQAIERVQQEINEDIKPTENNLKYINQNNEPTDKEIADAVRTLSKLGINPLANMNMGQFGAMNSEIAQINAMFGNNNNNNNNMMNFIPMISAMSQSGGGNSNISKEFVQAYMMNQMLPGFNFSNNDK